MIFLAFALAYAGMTALCLAMDRHHVCLFGQAPLPLRSQLLRLAGSLFLVLFIFVMIQIYGLAIGIAGAIFIMSIAGLCLIFLLPYAPRVAAWLGPAAGAIALVGILMSH